MRKSILCFLCVFLFCVSHNLLAQDITGLWKGWLYNDTTGVTHKYEIAISEENGKLFGYSHTWFILDDKQYYGVKKVSIRESEGKILVLDNGLIAHNYPVKPAKNVRQLNVLELDASGKKMILEGPFSTNRTKQYQSLTGFIHVERTNEYWQTSLVPHLQELKKLDDLSFISPTSPAPNATVAQSTPQNPKSGSAGKKTISAETVSTAASGSAISIQKNPSEIKQAPESGATLSSSAANTQAEIATAPASSGTALSQPEAGKKDTAAAALLEERMTEIQQTVEFSSDSLELSLYDNGEVDGDTVSVLLNGNLILAKQGLSTKAVKKTIYIPSGTNQVHLLMYAESLGSIPPNTGLLVVRDGKKLYELRFSGDLKKNAGIIFNRKKE